MTRGLRWTAEQVRRAKGGKIDADIAVSVADAKHARRATAKAKVETQEIYPRFRVRIHHASRRLADATGRSHKAAVDGLVRSGILPDDSPIYLESISETYEQAEDEETVIVVEEVPEVG